MIEPTVSSERDAASLAVVEEIATAKSASPAELTPPLYEVIDPEALNAVLRSSPGDDVTVTFEYQGLEVAVSDADTVSVETANDGATEPPAESHPPHTDGAE